jgi:hypothetical protein
MAMRRPDTMAALSISLGVAVGAVLAGCGTLPSASTGDPGDRPAVTLGGFAFGAKSNRIVHRYGSYSAGTRSLVAKGWGSKAGKRLTMTFRDGGLVARVKTVRMEVRQPAHGNNGTAEDWRWLAQDTQGNVHFLKRQRVDDGLGHSSPPSLEGVAAGGQALFALPRAAALKVGHAWYRYQGGKRQTRWKVLSTSVAWRGGRGLLRIEMIFDTDGDGKFEPTDERNDSYFRPNVGWYGETRYGPLQGGFVRQ